jgi:hypothetical protein
MAIRSATASRDRRSAEAAESASTDSAGRPLYCHAHNCQAVASSFAHGALCRWHASAPKHAWPRVTEEVSKMIFDMARERERALVPMDGEENAPETAEQTRERIREAGEALRRAVKALRGHDSRGTAWAHRLRAIEEEHGGRFPDGRRMTPAQRELWREALRHHQPASAE